MRTLSINVSEDVSIRGYFSKPRGVREEKSLENTAVHASLRETAWTSKHSTTEPSTEQNLILYRLLHKEEE